MRRLRRSMWQHVGIVRTREGLAKAAAELDALEAEYERGSSRRRQSGAALEFRNMLMVAQLVTRSARERQESRGLHFNADYPRSLPDPRDTALQPL